MNNKSLIFEEELSMCRDKSDILKLINIFIKRQIRKERKKLKNGMLNDIEYKTICNAFQELRKSIIKRKKYTLAKKKSRTVKFNDYKCDICTNIFISCYKKTPAICGDCYTKATNDWEWLQKELNVRNLKLTNKNFKYNNLKQMI